MKLAAMQTSQSSAVIFRKLINYCMTTFSKFPIIETIGAYGYSDRVYFCNCLFGFSAFKDRKKTSMAKKKGLKALENSMPQLLTVLVLVSVMLAVFNADVISRFIGEKSGFRGVLGAALIGSITLIPGFVAFSVAGELLRDGAGTLQIAAFVSTLMMVGIVTLPMEIRYFGKRTALLRNGFAFMIAFPDMAPKAGASLIGQF